MFLLIFRYVFGGAIDAGPVSYVTFMVPGYIVTSVLFTGSNASSSVAQDMEEGFTDRLPLAAGVPHRGAGRPGRRRDRPAGAGPGGHGGHRCRRRLPPQRHRVEALAAFGLTLVFGFAFMWVFVWLGLVAGNVQAAQGMSLLIFPLSFVSSAMVPVDSMPGWLQPVAEHQPITVMTNAVRSLALGDPSLAGLERLDRPLRHPGARVVGRPWWRSSPRWPCCGTGRPESRPSGERALLHPDHVHLAGPDEPSGPAARVVVVVADEQHPVSVARGADRRVGRAVVVRLAVGDARPPRRRRRTSSTWWVDTRWSVRS